MGRNNNGGGVKAYVAVVIIQCINAGLILLLKAALSAGLKPAVFIAYRHAVATLVLLPFMSFFSTHTSPPLTFPALIKIFFVATLGLVVGWNLQFAGLKLVSATFGMAVFCIVPSLVFIMAVCLRIEKLGFGEWYGQAKIVGTLIGVSGAMAFTLYKGPPLFNNHHHQIHQQQTTHMISSRHDWIKGSILTISAQIFYSLWLTLQGPLLKQYPGKLRLTFLQFGFSCISASIYGAALDRNLSSWKLGWNTQLLSIVYCGVIVMAICYSLQAWVIEKRGPVFTANFNPLALVLAAILSALFLHETLHWGSVLGCGLLIIGLYSFLWGRNKEAQNTAGPIEEAHFESVVIVSTAPNENDDDAPNKMME